MNAIRPRKVDTSFIVAILATIGADYLMESALLQMCVGHVDEALQHDLSRTILSKTQDSCTQSTNARGQT